MFPFVQNHDAVPIVMIECVTLQEKKKRRKRKTGNNEGALYQR